MQDYSKIYDTEDGDDFDGSIECYSVSTEKENLKNFLENEVGDDGKIYNSIKDVTKDILIIKNAFIEDEFRGNGFGIDMVNDVISESYSRAAILVCDTHESQKPGFELAKFYESLGFKTVTENSQNCPLMVYPEQLANKIKEKIEIKKLSKPRF